MTEPYIRAITIDWDKVAPDSFVRRIPALKGLRELKLSRNVTLFSGENGSGKSTVLEAVAACCGFGPEGGTINHRFSTWQEPPALGGAARLVRSAARLPSAGYFFRAESFFNVATAIMQKYNDDGKLPNFHERSHGESFLDFMSRSDRRGLFLMDEPEAALSPQRQLTLLIHIVRMAQAGSQFIIATHSPILLGIPDAEILLFGEDGIAPCPYEETESFRVTKLFLTQRELMLRRLLE